MSAERLAIDGGRPVRDRMLPYGHQIIDDTDIAAVSDVLRSDWLTTGPAVAAFEHAFAKSCGARFAVAVSSGTAALHIATLAAGVGPEHEVIVPALTFVASANCARYVGADPVFADVRDDTLSADPARVAECISARTRAIVAVDYSGQPADLDELLALTRSAGAVLIEDAAHSVGAVYRGRRVGGVADLTAFSLHPVKQMTAGEGGVVTTNDEALAGRLRLLRSHGIASAAADREHASTHHYEMVVLGYNYRLTDIQSALALSQLRRLPGWLERRSAIAAQYTAAFESVDAVRPLTTLPDRRSAWHIYPVRLRLERLRAGRDDVYRALRAENIGVNVHFIPVPWHPYYQQFGHRRGGWPVAETAYEQLLTLPLWPGMTDDDVDDVIFAVTKVCRAYRAVD